MYNKIEIDNQQGDVLTLPFDSTANGYIFKGVEGVDPVKATISSSTFAQLDGSSFQGARREMRNLLVKIGFEPDFSPGGKSVRELRSDLYAYLMPKTSVITRFYNDDDLYASISGMVESCDAAPFVQEPEAVASILCFDPNFQASAEIEVAGNTVSTSTETTIHNDGTVESGYVFTLNVNRTLADFTIYNRRLNGEVGSIDVTYPFLDGDVVKVSTMPRDKYITLTRGGITESILYAVTPGAKWGALYPGDNFFRVYASGAAIPWTLDYLPLLGGL